MPGGLKGLLEAEARDSVGSLGSGGGGGGGGNTEEDGALDAVLASKALCFCCWIFS